MNFSITKYLVLIILTFLLFGLAACGIGGNDEAANTEVIEVTFYGESCDTTAPEELPTGEYLFILHDLDGTTEAELYVGRITEGHTYQELLDPQETPGFYYTKPDWLIYAKKRGGTNNPEGELHYNVTLEPGEHAIYVANRPPEADWGIWFCAPVMVVEP
jgi:hypothetical protein